MIEVGVVFDSWGHAIYWHHPAENSMGAIPDSRDLWDVLWDHRDDLGGVAHTHPWDGPTGPSGTDVTTFAAIEVGLGNTLLWPIVTMTHVAYFCQNVLTKEYVDAGPVNFQNMDHWLDNIKKLRHLSRG